MQRLGKHIVRDSLRPKEYEPVLVSCGPHTIELAEQVALECQKVGADPALWLDTDTMFYGQFKNYTAENLKRVSAHCVGLLDYVTAYVWLGGVRDPSGMAKVPRDVWAAYNEGELAHWDRSSEKKPKNVSVASGLITRERAKSYGFNHAKWKAMVEAAIAVNYRQLESFGKVVASLLTPLSPVDVRVTADNATDLRFRLAGQERKAYVNDGVISDEDFAAENRDVSLPAGSVDVAPLEDSANGTFVADAPTPQYGKRIEGLAWTFRNGKVTDFTAKANLKLAQTGWEAATGEKDVFGSVTFGLNKKALPGFLQTSIVAGTVSVAIGDNRSLGGRNRSSFGAQAFLTSATVEVAGKTVIERGTWVI
ncbi:MAG: aminopeptidase [Euryarchaeota archaeon]|nr:aminopeptidase [Euryarchaeota archaeon]